MLNKHAHLLSKKQSQKKFQMAVVDSKKSCTFAPAKRAQVVELVDTLL